MRAWRFLCAAALLSFSNFGLVHKQASVFLASLAAALMFVAMPASAATLPDTSTSYSFLSGGNCVVCVSNDTGNVNIAFGGNQLMVFYGATSGKFAGFPPSILVGVENQGPGGGPTLVSNVFGSFWFAVNGPSGVSVPLVISALMAGSAASGTSVNVVLDLVHMQGSQLFGTTLGSVFADQGPQQIVSLVAPVTAISGDLYQLQMAGNASDLTGTVDVPNAQISGLQVSFANAADASEFTLQFSPNVFDAEGPIVVTPIPGALPLFITGLAMLGLLTWRRKRKAAA
jgi:hypothetical protein